jgi:uncharacterized membrane protein
MSHTYSFEHLQKMTNQALLDKNMPEKLYTSVNSISKILDAIIKTNGKGWAATVVDNDGKPLLTEQEQQKFTDLFEPYIDQIIHFFTKDTQSGGEYDAIKASGLTREEFMEKMKEANPTTFSINNIYYKFFQKLFEVDDITKTFASQYGITRLEKTHDLQGDLHLFPPIVSGIIADGLAILSDGAILPAITQDTLSKVKIPFRTIVFICYLAFDIARISFGILEKPYLRKVFSILVSILDLLKGDWKKAILSFVGFFGMAPMLYAEIGRIFLTLFEMLAPQLQMSVIFGGLDITKSLIIGILLSIFQVTAPDFVRLPVIGGLEEIAKMKAKMDNKLIEEGQSARPDYFAPTFDDLNNIQAVFRDPVINCSKEFQDAITPIKNSSILRLILEMLGIVLDDISIEERCGKVEPAAKELENSAKELEQQGQPEEKQEQSPQQGGRKLRYKSTSS